MRCQIKAESLLFPTMYKSQKVTFPTCSGFCGSGSHMNFERIMFTNQIVLKSGTLGVRKQNTFRCSKSVTIFSVLIWDTFFAVYFKTL